MADTSAISMSSVEVLVGNSGVVPPDATYPMYSLFPGRSPRYVELVILFQSEPNVIWYVPGALNVWLKGAVP